MAPGGDTPATSRSPAWLAALVLVVAVFLAYSPAFNAGFIWDDDTHVTLNPRVTSPDGLRATWTSAEANYFPLVLTHFWVLHAIWGLDPQPYHVATIALHALCAVLCWRVLRRLGIAGAWLGAAAWALHPVQVESVAWISELKNTQSCVFFLLAVHFFLRWIQPRSGEAARPRHYALALVCAGLAILSKPSTVMLPPALALAWWWLKGEWRWRYLVSLAPFFLLSLLASGWTIWEQKHHAGAIGPAWDQSWPQRLVLAGKATWFYLGKLLWPEPLVFIYPRWTLDASRIVAWLPTLAAAGLLIVAWLKRATVARHGLFAFGFFLVMLFPILGFFSVYFFQYSFVADHFQYLASIGPIALLAALLARFGPAPHRAVGLIVAGVWLLVLGALTWREAHVYRDDETLFRHVLARNPDAWMAHTNLGVTLLNSGRISEAAAEFELALRGKPDDAIALTNMGAVRGAAGDFAEALRLHGEAVQRDPRNHDAHANLGTTLAAVGRWEEAVPHYREALRLKPNLAKVHYNWGNDLFQRGEKSAAVQHYTQAVQIDPRFAAAHYNLGVVLGALGRLPEAIPHYERTIALQPEHVDAHLNLALALRTTGRVDEARVRYEKARQLKPTLPPMAW